jgi:hypothetical protein
MADQDPSITEQAVRQFIALVDGPQGDAAHADYATLIRRAQEILAQEQQTHP